jgi:hypothetical protein
MRRRLFTLLSALSPVLCGPTFVGCGSGPHHPVELQAYNAANGEPLGGVRVVRWDYILGGKPATFPGPSGLTGADGLIGSAIHEFAPSFIFSKDGFLSAEVRVAGDDAYVASPSNGNRWYRVSVPWLFRPLTEPPLPPVLYEREVPARPLIRVPLWPIAPNASPTTSGRRDGSDAGPPEPFLPR